MVEWSAWVGLAVGAFAEVQAEATGGLTVGRVLMATLMAVIAMLSLLIGSALGLFAKPSQRMIAAVMAFGTGALIQALAVELAFENAAHLVREAHLDGISSWLWVAGGFVVGGVTYFLGNRMVEQRGGALRHPATAKGYLLEKKREEAAPLLARLAQVDFLRSLPPGEMEPLLPHVRPVQVPAGQVIFQRGDSGDALYIIGRGQVEVLPDRLTPAAPEAASGSAPRPGSATATSQEAVGVDDDGRVNPAVEAEHPAAASGERPAVLARLGPGSSFGEMALLSGEPRSATVVASEETDLLRIEKEDFDHLITQSRTLRDAVEQLATQRLVQNIRTTAGEVDAQRWQRVAMANIQRLSRSEQAVLMQEHSGGAPLAIFLGALLDGIPESVVIGASFLSLATFNPTFLVAVFLSNLPEAMASAAGMREGGFSTARIFTLWGSLVVGGAIAAGLGNAFLTSAPPTALAFVNAVAGGGVLALVASVMMPEAFEQGGSSVGLATIAGFLSAFFFTALGLHG